MTRGAAAGRRRGKGLYQKEVDSMSGRAMATAVSGLRDQQVMLDVIANNISNSGTTGFKRGRITFKESFAALLQGASKPPGNLGGVNPFQVGTGAAIGSIDNIMEQGNIQSTGNQTDLAIQGDGFFVVFNGQRDYYTRAGAFQWDFQGRLVVPTSGMTVRGRIADPKTGIINEGSPVSDIKVLPDTVDAAKATTLVDFVGNLNAEDVTHSAAVQVFDSLGNAHTLTLQFKKDVSLQNQWDWNITVLVPAERIGGYDGTVTFDANGYLLSHSYSQGAISFTFDSKNGADVPIDIVLNFGTPGSSDGISQFSNTSTVIARDQNGYSSGVLNNVSIDAQGVITGLFTNMKSRPIAQLVLATFNNPAGLLRVGDNTYDVSANSGLAMLKFAGSSINTTIIPGAVEMSNVDIAEEFTNMIMAQRTFQANARTVVTSDEIMQETVNLKR